MISISKLGNFRSNAFRAACIMFALFGVISAQQTNEKLVEVKNVAQITDAVMISGISVNGRPVECGLFIKPPAVVQPVTPFQAGSDWLQQMTISLVNRTAKTVVSGAITLMFLDTGDCRSLPCVTEQIHLGQMPSVDAYDSRTGQPLKPEHPETPPLDWKSAQTYTVRVGDYMDEIGTNLSHSPNQLAVTAVSKVAVYIGPFFFADGMRWFGLRYSVPDPEHPGRFKDLPEGYFPGKRGSNWPPGYSQ